MAVVADYVVVRDAPRTLKRGGGGDPDTNFTFTLPGEALRNRQMVLQFFYASFADADDLDLRIQANGEANVKTVHNVTGEHDASVMEVIPGDAFEHGSNELTATLVSGTGRLRISDVVLWFKQVA